MTVEQDRLVTENIGLVHACARRYMGRGIDYDDLYQSGCEGLVKAAAGYDIFHLCCSSDTRGDTPSFSGRRIGKGLSESARFGTKDSSRRRGISS